MSYFLVVYDRSNGALDIAEYGDDEADRAMHDRFRRELAEREHPEVEVVVLAASSLEALKNTHSRYFKTVGELAEAGLSTTVK